MRVMYNTLQIVYELYIILNLMTHSITRITNILLVTERTGEGSRAE
jgi:hypothetical protein